MDKKKRMLYIAVSALLLLIIILVTVLLAHQSGKAQQTQAESSQSPIASEAIHTEIPEQTSDINVMVPSETSPEPVEPSEDPPAITPPAVTAVSPSSDSDIVLTTMQPSTDTDLPENFVENFLQSTP